MTGPQKTLTAVLIVVASLVASVALVLWLLNTPDRAADAVRAEVGDVTESEGPGEDSEDLEPVPFEMADLMFTGSSALGEQPGFFEGVSGVIYLDREGAPSGLRGEVDMGSVMTNSDRLTNNLKTEAGFFQVAQYPTASFISTGIEPTTDPAGAEEATHRVHGHFTLRGVTRSISFPAMIEVTSERVSLESEFSVNRQDFGVSYEGGAAFPDIRDLVLINLSIEATRSSRPAANDTSNPTSHEPTTRPAP